MALSTVALICAVMLSVVAAQSTHDDSEEADQVQACDSSTVEQAVQCLQSDIDELKRLLTVHSSVTGNRDAWAISGEYVPGA